MPSPEVSACSPRPPESPKHQKQLNIKFNKLRGSQSLPDLSQEQEEKNASPEIIPTSTNTESPKKPSDSMKSPKRNSKSSTPDYTPPSIHDERPKIDITIDEEISEEIVFNPISQDTQDDIPEEIMLNRSILFHKQESRQIPVRSSGEEVIANMQSLLDIEESINVSYKRSKSRKCSPLTRIFRLMKLKMMFLIKLSRRVKLTQRPTNFGIHPIQLLI